MTKRSSRSPISHEGGFTLVEILMVTLVMSIFAGGLMAFLINGTQSFSSQSSMSSADADARRALQRFTQDVRQAITPDRELTAPVDSISATAAVVYTEVFDRTAGTTGEPRPKKVEYRLVGTILERRSTDPVGATSPFTYGTPSVTEILAGNIQMGSDAVFTAFDDSGNVLALPVVQRKRIATIRIRLKLGQKTGASTTTTEIATNVTLRNRIL